MNDQSSIDGHADAKDAVTRATLSQREDTARAMKKPTPASTVKMALRAYKRAEKAVAEVLKSVPPPAPIACKAGCPWCCYIRLTASPPEVLAVLDTIHETFSKAEVAALKRKVANVDGYTRGLDGDARARLRLPCPLLKAGSCSVHPVRPLSCRAVASVDVAACMRAHASRMQEPVPQLDWQIRAANGVGYGLYAGLADAGFPVEDVEMNAALALALEDRDIGKRWLGGAPVFRPATEIKPPKTR